ncbi:aspartyl-phosphate phosphatase Spo0E family protein [Alkalihalobacillus sp. LMS39]|uniref:aspartyl-phosphate phosphatase Spo0E family protein n=1 Tax=Alkalihalobacillus sp. LMS39 TaxID=2924032 RepID=UPI001FB20E79|nr:aspartyl-phosphate phosphatase Spo0E family protein [Alkalihalobacillus sp. LMS39]UOE92747.1 aspartyl-phosphate phosphatase Spo0E family protein [Alkalihalobacillus sp. LMS39]
MENKLLAAIEEKRTELIEIGLRHGLDSSLALKLSQELDKLLNRYNESYVHPHYKNKKMKV